MKIRGKDILTKYRNKNLSNRRLTLAINQLIADLESNSIMSPERLSEIRKDADKVHGDGFYFLNLHSHRTLVLIELLNNKATIVWIGNHEDYVLTFKNNKNTIERWLRNGNWID